MPVDILPAIPGVGGTEFHDWHHSNNRGNFASCFSAIDKLFGTDRESVEGAKRAKGVGK